MESEPEGSERLERGDRQTDDRLSELTPTLQAALAQKLPEYMVPQYWVQLSELPLTPNGKVDRRALPQPELTAATGDYVEPANELEALLADVWQDVLGVPRVGTRDNFFALGGDSIKAIQMGSRLQKHGWKLEMKELFQHPTIEQVLPYLRRAETLAADQGSVLGEVRMTPIQKWFFERGFADAHHWNQSVMLHAPSGFDPRLVRMTLGKLLEHHDALRMEFALEPGRPGEPAKVIQHNRAPEDVRPDVEVIPVAAGNEGPEEAVRRGAERIQGSLDPVRGTLVKAAIFQTEQGDHLLLVIHHLVVDGVSWRILLEDFATVYAQASRGEAILLPEKTHSFQAWAARLAEYANSRAFLKEAAYWRELESVPTAPLSKDNEAADQRMLHARTVDFALTAQETEQLTTLAHEAYRTEMNDLLLTALGLALKEWSGQERIAVLLEGHGREELFADVNVSRTVGWFTSQYPVVLDLERSDDLAYQIKRMKEDLRHIPNKGIGYGMLRYLTEEAHREGLAFSLRPDISFNYLGQFADMAESGRFARSSWPMGNPLSPNSEKPTPLDVVGFIEGGVLRMSISYHSEEYEAGTVAALSGRFKAHLQRLIEFCLGQSGSMLTPSDLGDDELTLDELDQLLQLF
ncbi:condensation domain-containing protein [Paenibacillus macerans]|uniref:condensation domain-containing protein n=1 Tax=Paenibacillus macerans TaxID=44252 RepID=UPI003D30FB5A